MNKRLSMILAATMMATSITSPLLYANDATEEKASSILDVNAMDLDQENNVTTQSAISVGVDTTTKAVIDVISNFTYENQGGKAVNVKFTGEIPADGRVIFPSEIDGLPVSSIGSFALSDITEYSSETIDAYKAHVSQVNEVVLPESVEMIKASAFAHCSGLQEINVPSNLETIEGNAFFAADLESFDASNTQLKSIGVNCFFHNENLETVILPPTLESLGNYVFCETPALKSIDLSETKLTSMPEGGFAESGAAEIKLPTTIETLGQGAFGYMTNLQELDLSQTHIKATGLNMCQDSSSLKKVIFPDTLQTIDLCAFYDATALVETNISELTNLTFIDNSAFMNAKSLTSLTLPEGVKTISKAAFRGCSALTKVVLPESFQSAYANSFDKTVTLYVTEGSKAEAYAVQNGFKYEIAVDESMYNYAVENGEAVNVKYIGEIPADGTIVFPAKLGGAPVTSIGAFAASDITSYTADNAEAYKAHVGAVKKVVLPNTIKDIEDSAFVFCMGLQDINLPSSLENVGGSAFFRTDLKTFDASHTSLRSIGIDTFYGNKNLETVVVPSTLESLGKYAFCQTPALKGMDLSETSLTSMPEGGFAESGAAEIKLPTTIETLGQGAFGYMTNLEELDLSQTQIKASGLNMCQDSRKLKKVIFPDTLQTIDVCAFYNATGLVETNISELTHLVSVGNASFENAKSLASITLPEGLKNVNKAAFRGCSALTKVVLPESFQSGYANSFDKTVTLYVTEGSKAEAYAVQNGFKYEIAVDESMYSYAVENGEAVNVKYIGEIPADGTVVFPSKLGGVPVTSIGAFAASDITSYTADNAEAYKAHVGAVKKVVLPNTVKDIKDSAFVFCMGLQDINLPSSLENVEGSAFFRTDLKAFDASHTNLKSIGIDTFFGNKNLETVVVPSTLESLGKYAFCQTPALKNMDLSETSLTSMPEGGFAESGVAEIKLPTTIETLGQGAFGYMANLKELDLSQTKIKASGLNMCQDSSSLKKVIFPDTLQTIDVCAFYNATGLVETNISELTHLVSVGNASFENAKSLASITLPEGFKNVNKAAFRGCSALAEVVLPESFQGGYANSFEKTVTLKVYAGSKAENYAKANGFKYEVIEEN